MAGKKGVRLFSVDGAAGHFGFDMVKYPDCARWVVSQLHPDGGKCPTCSKPISDRQREAFSHLKSVRCSQCSTKFSATSNTPLSGSTLEVREVYLIAVFTHLGVPTAKIATQIGIQPRTVTNWQAHFRAQQELEAQKTAEVTA